jgi:hypothetical protein
VPDHVRAVGSGGIQDGDRVRHVPADVERPGGDRRSQATLLVPDDPEAVSEFPAE